MSSESNTQLNTPIVTEQIRIKIREYLLEKRGQLRADHSDSARFGLGEIQEKIRNFDNLTEKDVAGLAARIKRRKHATAEDMYRLQFSFLQNENNINKFANITGAMQVLIKELTGMDSEKQIAALECLCNLSLGNAAICEKIAMLAGSYLVTYLNNTEERLKRTSLWTLTNILETGGKGAKTLMQMELLPKLWNIYIACDKIKSNTFSDSFSQDAAICLQVISLKSEILLNNEDLMFLNENLHTKNPTCSGGEYHLEIIFNCGLLDKKYELNNAQLLYLINYSLSNLYNTRDLNLHPSRLRIVFAVRILANLIAYPKANTVDMLIRQISMVWQSNLISLLNKIFGLQNPILTKETLWLVKNLLHFQNQDNNSQILSKNELLKKLIVPSIVA